MLPTFMYHPTLAPAGKKFTDDAAFNALGPDWVDTPAKFPPPEQEPVKPPKPRGWTPRTELNK